jgi:hypothetical protein
MIIATFAIENMNAEEVDTVSQGETEPEVHSKTYLHHQQYTYTLIPITHITTAKTSLYMKISARSSSKQRNHTTSYRAKHFNEPYVQLLKIALTSHHLQNAYLHHFKPTTIIATTTPVAVDAAAPQPNATSQDPSSHEHSQSLNL